MFGVFPVLNLNIKELYIIESALKSGLNNKS